MQQPSLLAVYRDILLAYLYVVDFECGNFLTDPCQLDLVGSRVNLFKFRFSLSKLSSKPGGSAVFVYKKTEYGIPIAEHLVYISF